MGKQPYLLWTNLALLGLLTGCQSVAVVPSYRLPPPQPTLAVTSSEVSDSGQPESVGPPPPPTPSSPNDRLERSSQSRTPIEPVPMAGEACGVPGEAVSLCGPSPHFGIPIVLPALPWHPRLPRIPLPGENIDEAPWPRFHPVPTRPVFEPPPEEIAGQPPVPSESLPPKRLLPDESLQPLVTPPPLVPIPPALKRPDSHGETSS